MRNLVYLNGDGMVNVHPNRDTTQINDEWYFEMNEEDFMAYCMAHDLDVDNGKLIDREDGYVFVTVLEVA